MEIDAYSQNSELTAFKLSSAVLEISDDDTPPPSGNEEVGVEMKGMVSVSPVLPETNCSNSNNDNNTKESHKVPGDLDFDAEEKLLIPINSLLTSVHRDKSQKHKKPFSNQHACEICGKKFNAKKLFMRHVANHSQRKLNSCKTCGKSFIQQINLINHQR